MAGAPPDFAQDVQRARRGRHRGDLQLFAQEVAGLAWEQEGRRLIDDALRGLPEPPLPPANAVLFTGHMVDAPDREKSRMRFPPTPEAEATARALVEEAVKAEIAHGGSVVGIAGGACGSDILFHEACRTLEIETRLFLPFPRDEFEAASVQRGGPRWVERYNALCDRVPARVLQDGAALPGWLMDKPDYDVWQRNNQWLLFNALATDAPRKTLMALYNPSLDPDGPGGTKHMIEIAHRWGIASVEHDARALLA